MDNNEDTGEPTVTSWSPVWVTALFSFVQGIVLYGFFKRQRRKDAQRNSYDLFEPRQFTRAHRSPPPFEQHWAKAALAVSDEDTLRDVGLDSYMFLRFLRLGTRIAAVGTLLSVILIPIYATGEARGPETEEFNQITLARVGADSNRLWASLICWFIFIGFILRDFWMEWTAYATYRYEFLAKGDVDMPRDFRYAIRVENVPLSKRTNAKLSDYFEHLFPNKVRQTSVCLEVTALQKEVNERQANIEALEKAVAFTHAKPDKPRPQTKINGNKCGCGGEKVDAIEHYQEEIDRLNDEIDTDRAALLAVAAQDDVEDPSTPPVQVSFSSDAAGDDGESTDIVVQTNDKDVDDIDKEDKKTPPAPGRPSSTAYVTFTSLRAKQAAVQCELSGKKDNMDVFVASDPKGVLWNNITIPLTLQHTFELQAAAFWTTGILFWAVPVAFVTSIANLNSILSAFGVKEVDSSSFWYGLVSGLLPVIALAILMAVLYMAIVACATHFIRKKSMPEVDSYALYWHQLFQFANLWLILIGGSVFNQIDSLIKDPASVATVIAAAMPGASVFFVNIISVSTFGAFGLELSMLPTYGVKLIIGLIQPEAMRTQRMLDEGKKPPSIVWGQELPPIVFIFLVTVLYMPIVPIMEIFALVYFAGSYVVWKHQCLHVYAAEFEGGGEATWQKLFGFLMGCLYMAEVVFIAYMGVKEAPVQGGLGFIPLVVTILMHFLLGRNIRQPLKYLSLEAAAEVDTTDGELEQTTSKSIDDQLYGQPVLKASEDEREPMPYRRDVKATLETTAAATTTEEVAPEEAETGVPAAEVHV